jgi:hypothetical protein
MNKSNIEQAPTVRKPLRPQSEATMTALRRQYEAMNDPTQAPLSEETESWHSIRTTANKKQLFPKASHR